MKLKEIVELLDAEVVVGKENLDKNVDFAFASDLMSDVLTLRTEDFLLITGLSNNQCIRTAEMSDVSYVLIARNKEVTKDMIEMAKDNDMVLMRTKYSLFKTSGILYGKGLKPVY
ncbi:MAG: DRTGG domain-containing protein [Bacteroidales bacterium]